MINQLQWDALKQRVFITGIDAGDFLLVIELNGNRRSGTQRLFIFFISTCQPDIPAQWQNPERIGRAVFAMPPDLGAHANRKFTNQNPGPLGKVVVAIFMHQDQQSKDNNKGNNR